MEHTYVLAHFTQSLRSPRMRKPNQAGQGMTEYIILVALIAIICIAAVKFFGNSTKEGFKEASTQIGGVTQDMKDAR